MHSIEIDFEVFKALTAKRASEAVTYNDVIRDLLGLSQKDPKASNPSSAGSNSAWIYKGIRFPEGTEFRAAYKGVTHHASVKGGVFVDEHGNVRNSPSEAACAITQTSVNGWNFWECRLPGATKWRPLKALR